MVVINIDNLFGGQRILFELKMLTDMTPTAGQLYGSQLPAMTMNIKNVSKFLQHLYKTFSSYFAIILPYLKRIIL